jgi:hypothetical protein
LALMGLATLWMAIVADMGTSLIVIFNALRLLKMRKSEKTSMESIYAEKTSMESIYAK